MLSKKAKKIRKTKISFWMITTIKKIKIEDRVCKEKKIAPLKLRPEISWQIFPTDATNLKISKMKHF